MTLKGTTPYFFRDFQIASTIDQYWRLSSNNGKTSEVDVPFVCPMPGIIKRMITNPTRPPGGSNVLNVDVRLNFVNVLSIILNSSRVANVPLTVNGSIALVKGDILNLHTKMSSTVGLDPLFQHMVLIDWDTDDLT